MTYVVGLTGGIGSGKSRVLQLFAAQGVPYYTADIQAKRLMQTDSGIRKALIRSFGEDVFDSGGRLNTRYLAEIVFRDTSRLRILNEIVHPAVHRDFIRWKNEISYPYVIYENAVLFESGADVFCDFIMVITAPENERIRRVVERDGVTEEQVRDRIRNQLPEREKIKRADYVIHNIDWEQTRKEVLGLHRMFLEKFSR